MVYFIKAKKEIQEAILKVLNRDRETHIDTLIASLKLETGLTYKLIADIINDMKTIGQVETIDGILKLKGD